MQKRSSEKTATPPWEVHVTLQCEAIFYYFLIGRLI